MSDSPFVPIEEVMTERGLTERQVKADVRNGYLPGHIDHYGKVVIPRYGEVSWNAYATGEWIPPETGSHKKAKTEQPERQPVGIVSIGKAS